MFISTFEDVFFNLLLGKCEYKNFKLTNGIIERAKYRSGDYLKFTCQTSYQKAKDILCLSDGFWSDMPDCVKRTSYYRGWQILY